MVMIHLIWTATGSFTYADMAILDEEEKQRTTGGNKNSGCCIAFLALSTSVLLSIWGIPRIT